MTKTDKEQFWDSLRGPLPRDRSCSNCKLKKNIIIVDIATGVETVVKGAFLCSQGHDVRYHEPPHRYYGRYVGDCYEHAVYPHVSMGHARIGHLNLPNRWEWDGENE